MRAGAAAQQQVGGGGRRGTGDCATLPAGDLRPGRAVPARPGAGLGVSRGQVQTAIRTENVQLWRRVGNARKTGQEVGNAVS